MAIDYDQLVQAYHDNADYAETGSAAKARAFITACRRLAGIRPDESSNRETSTRFDAKVLQAERNAAEQWLDAHDPGGPATRVPTGVAHFSFRRFR